MWSTRSLSSRTIRPKSTVSSSSSAVSSVAAASASRCSRARRASTSGRTSGASPGITSTSPSRSGSSEKAVRATLTASPVPRCTRCSTNSIGISVAICSCRVFVTRSAPWPTTITMRSSGSATSASTTCSSIGTAAERVQHLRGLGPHAGALAGGEHHGRQRPVAHSTLSPGSRSPWPHSGPVSPRFSRWLGAFRLPLLAQRWLGHRIVGARGSNPRLGTPKRTRLPLHHLRPTWNDTPPPIDCRPAPLKNVTSSLPATSSVRPVSWAH